MYIECTECTYLLLIYVLCPGARDKELLVWKKLQGPSFSVLVNRICENVHFRSSRLEVFYENSHENIFAGVQKQPPDMFCKKGWACKFFKKRLQHRCFSLKFAKSLRAHILENICKRLLIGVALG